MQTTLEKSGIRQRKPTQEESSQKCILQPITKVRNPSNSFKMYQKLIFRIFTSICYHVRSKDLTCCLTCLIFLKFSWQPVRTFSAQTHLNFQMNLLKVKIRKEHKKIFCDSSNIFKNISRSINVCLKYFMTTAKTLRPPS